MMLALNIRKILAVARVGAFLFSTGPMIRGCAGQVDVTSAGETDPKVTTIVDLSSSEGFPFANDAGESIGAQTVIAYAADQPTIRTVTVLEHGKIVAEYVRDDVNPLIPNPVWSTTKSWMSLLVGCMIQDGLIDLDETLGDILGTSDTWNSEMTSNSTADDMAYREAVTLKRLLSMTSGLMSPLEGSNETEVVFMDGGNLGGASMTGALMDPRVEPDEKGNFQYLAANNILSYVIQQRTNKTPREYLAEKVLPFLGIDNESIGWWKNTDGVEYAYHGLLLTPLQMLKFGQLYLQQGLSNSTHQLISPEWIEASTSLQGGTFFYGYLMWVFFGALLERPQLEKIVCAQGLGGQDICYSPSTHRVIAQQRDLSAETEGTDSDSFETLEIVALALDPELRFATGEEVNGIDDEVDQDPTSTEEGDNVIDESQSAAPTSITLPIISILAYSVVNYNYF